MLICCLFAFTNKKSVAVVKNEAKSYPIQDLSEEVLIVNLCQKQKKKHKKGTKSIFIDMTHEDAEL